MPRNNKVTPEIEPEFPFCKPSVFFFFFLPPSENFFLADMTLVYRVMKKTAEGLVLTSDENEQFIFDIVVGGEGRGPIWDLKIGQIGFILCLLIIIVLLWISLGASPAPLVLHGPLHSILPSGPSKDDKLRHEQAGFSEPSRLA